MPSPVAAGRRVPGRSKWEPELVELGEAHAAPRRGGRGGLSLGAPVTSPFPQRGSCPRQPPRPVSYGFFFLRSLLFIAICKILFRLRRRLKNPPVRRPAGVTKAIWGNGEAVND